MHSRLLIVLTIAGLSFAGCSSDGDDNASTTDTTEIDGDTSDTSANSDESAATTEAPAVLELTSSAPAAADIAIDASGITTDRPIQHGGQAAIEQGQTFMVDDDATLAQVSFHVSAPDGVEAGRQVELALYEVGDAVASAPSGIVALDADVDRLVAQLPAAIGPGESSHIVFNVPDVALSAGQYAVVLSFTEGGAPAAMDLQHPAGDVYADGTAISLEGEFWKPNTNGHDSAVTISFGS